MITRLGPSQDEGPRTQPHIGPMLVSEFSVHICYTVFYQCALSRGQTILQCEQSKGGQTNVMTMVQCVLSRGQAMLQYERTNLWLGQWPNITYINKECCKVFNRKEDKPMFYQGVFLLTGQGTNVICAYNVTTLKET